MNRLHSFSIAAFAILLPLCLCGGCDDSPEIIMTPEGTFSAYYLQGQEAARQYAKGDLEDYALVWKLHDLQAANRQDFLDGFAAGLAETHEDQQVSACRAVLEETVRGNQFQTAQELGTKHARKSVTNEQIQGIIHSSLGVSQGVSLGWKAGYVKGFAAQRVAETAASASVNEEAIQQFHREAAAMYHALRAAIGR